MPQRQGQPSRPAAQSPPVMADPGFRITTTNENWRGKNDPAERRRIQNRLNQRAFRERQRAGETAREYTLRSQTATSTPVPQQQQQQPESDNDDDNKEEDEADDEEDEEESEEEEDDDEEGEEDSSSEEEEDDDDDDEAEQSNPGSPPIIPARPYFTGQIPRAACTPSTPSADNPWDELAQLINRNFMQAATSNAQRLGLNLASLRTGAAASTPRLRNTANLPPTLKPVELQHQLPHDPIIDTIPHARLRFNILRAIATGNVDAARFSACLRRSGAVVNVQGEARRSGLIVWNFPEQLSSWELSEAFVMIWGFLLEGCEDFVAATNVWRTRRGERSLVLGAKAGGR